MCNMLNNGEYNIFYSSYIPGKPEGRRPLGRPRRRWVDNIRMDLQEVGCGYMDWIGLAQDRDGWRTLVSVVMNLRVPWNAANFLTSCKPVSFSRTLHHGVSKLSIFPTILQQDITIGCVHCHVPLQQLHKYTIIVAIFADIGNTVSSLYIKSQ